MIWHASNEYEEENIRSQFGNRVPVMTARDLTTAFLGTEERTPRGTKRPGCLRIVFLSRISRKKNLSGALKMLEGLRGDIRFNIYGPLEDKGYWAECQKIINSLPHNVQVRYCGDVVYDRVIEVLADHDLFLLPTLGENFGHVILEALVAGCPVLTSDRTPWRGLQDIEVGWDLPLSTGAFSRRATGMRGDGRARPSQVVATRSGLRTRTRPRPNHAGPVPGAVQLCAG